LSGFERRGTFRLVDRDASYALSVNECRLGNVVDLKFDKPAGNAVLADVPGNRMDALRRLVTRVVIVATLLCVLMPEQAGEVEAADSAGELSFKKVSHAGQELVATGKNEAPRASRPERQLVGHNPLTHAISCGAPLLGSRSLRGHEECNTRPSVRSAHLSALAVVVLRI
jgi:hypothetical protein